MSTVRITKQDAEAAAREVDWAKIDAMTDEDIERQVAENPDAPPLMSDAELESLDWAFRVQRLRKRTTLTQSAFAERYKIPLATLRDWEQGRRTPDATVQAYFTVIEREPEMVAAVLAAE
jgi:putative transcriptional regulator